MIEETIELKSEIGLHARPASRFVVRVTGFKSNLTLIKNGKEYDGKSIMNVLSMGARNLDKITVRADGEDEEEALKSILEFLENGLN